MVAVATAATDSYDMIDVAVVIIDVVTCCY